MLETLYWFCLPQALSEAGYYSTTTVVKCQWTYACWVLFTIILDSFWTSVHSTIMIIILLKYLKTKWQYVGQEKACHYRRRWVLGGDVQGHSTAGMADPALPLHFQSCDVPALYICIMIPYVCGLMAELSMLLIAVLRIPSRRGFESPLCFYIFLYSFPILCFTPFSTRMQ
jgi:hypothetical protein